MSGRRDYGPLVEAVLRRDIERIMEVLPTVTEQDYFDSISILLGQARQNSFDANVILHAIKDRVCILNGEPLYELFEIAMMKKMDNYIDTILQCRNFNKNLPGLLLNVQNLEQLQYLMRKGIPFPIDQQEKNNILSNIIKTRSLELVEFFISRGAKAENYDLIRAVTKGLDNMIPILIKAGANIEIDTIITAILYSDSSCLRELLPLDISYDYRRQIIESISHVDSLSTEEEKISYLTDLLEPLKPILDEYNIQLHREATAERREQARKIIAKGDEKRRIALEEYKTRETKEEIDPDREMVQNTCTDNSQNSLLGDELKDTDDIVVFYLGALKGEASSHGEARLLGECYLKSELRDYLNSLYSNDMVYEWLGPPSPFGIPGHPPIPDRTKPVYKLPWTGTWIKGKVLERILYEKGTIAIELIPTKMSIGSQYAVSALHGQWGGHWRKVGNNAEYVESGDAQPDDRELVYDLPTESYL